MNGVNWLAERILAAAAEAMEERRDDADAARQSAKFSADHNPRPAGVIREGSATWAVLEYLRTHPKAFFQRDQLVLATGRTGKAVDWALLFLRARGLVRVAHDTTRNHRYLRYALAAKKVGRP